MLAAAVATMVMMVSQSSAAALAQLIQYPVAERIEILIKSCLPENFLNSMSCFQMMGFSLGMFATWSSSLKSSSRGFTMRFRLEV
jgi:hypothetical protein